jgi:hypothetical protein
MESDENMTDLRERIARAETGAAKAHEDQAIMFVKTGPSQRV